MRTGDLRYLTLGDLRRFLGARSSRLLANNTWAEADSDGSVGVRLHATRIITFHADGESASPQDATTPRRFTTFTVNSGGYWTTTTKQRLNALLPAGYRVFTKDFAWNISTPEGTFPFEDGKRLCLGKARAAGPEPADLDGVGSAGGDTWKVS